MYCDFDCAQMKYYSADLPYPDVIIEKPNRKYAMIVSGAFAGKGSETTAIAQYSVHRLYIEKHPELFNAYKYIAATEMIHWELLGKLVRNLGLKPRLFSYESNSFWSGRYPMQETELKKIITSDIQGERDAIAHYRRMIKQIDVPNIQALFQRIILDEEKHIEVLTEFYNQY